MPKRLAFFAVSIGILSILISPACSFFEDDVKKAKEFMAAGMYPQAIELLNKRIKDKPNDAEAHFQLGICYLNTVNFGGAEERFASAVRLKSDYGFKIGDEFKKSGSDALNKGQVQQAQGLFSKAVQYQPNLKGTIANEMFSKGESSIGQGRVTDAYFDLAVQYDPGLKDKVCDVYYNKGKASSGELQAALYQQALRYCTKYGEEIKATLCDFYFEKGKSADKDSLRYFQEAQRFGSKHDKEMGKYLLKFANDIKSRSERKQYLTKTISGYISDEEALEATVQYYTSKWGEPKKWILKNVGEWTEVGRVRYHDYFFSLSLEPFMLKTNRGQPENVKSDIADVAGGWFMSNDIQGKETPLWLKQGDKQVSVYLWLLDNAQYEKKPLQ